MPARQGPPDAREPHEGTAGGADRRRSRGPDRQAADLAPPSSGDVDGYIASAPPEAQPLLRQLRELVKAAAPAARERLSYGMPAYDHHGRITYFAAFKNHVGMYGFSSADLAAHGLQAYAAGRGTLRLPLGKPLPVDRIRGLLAARVSANEARRGGTA